METISATTEIANTPRRPRHRYLRSVPALEICGYNESITVIAGYHREHMTRHDHEEDL